MQLDLNGLLDELAERIAEKLRENQVGTPNKSRLLSIEDAAEYIGRTKVGMNHLIAAGKIPVVRADRRVMLDVRDLDHWIEHNKVA